MKSVCEQLVESASLAQKLDPSLIIILMSTILKMMMSTWLRSFSISFLPRSSAHLVQDLVKAFFLDWDQFL